MGNKLITRFRKVFDGNQSGVRKVKSITSASEVNVNYPSIQTDGDESVVDNLGNFTRNASGSVRSTNLSRNKVSFAFIFRSKASL